MLINLKLFASLLLSFLFPSFSLFPTTLPIAVMIKENMWIELNTCFQLNNYISWIGQLHFQVLSKEE